MMNTTIREQLIEAMKNKRCWRTTSTDYQTYFEIPKPRVRKERILRGQSTPVRIKRALIDTMIEAQQMMVKECGFVTRDNTINPTPFIFVLGQKGNVITDMEFVLTGGSGCGYMAAIYPEQLAEAMFKVSKRGLFVAGLARVALCESITTNGYDDSFGGGLKNILSSTSQQGLAFVSMVRKKFNVQMPNAKQNNYINYSYKII